MRHLVLFEAFQDGIVDHEDLEDHVTYSVIIDDERIPGGTPEQILQDYYLKAEIVEDGTLKVTGAGQDIKQYLEDYGITLFPDDIDEITPSIQWQ